MSDVVSVKVNASKINLKIEEMPEQVREALLDTIVTEGGKLVDLARGRAEQLLQVRTGKFVSRIKFGLRQRKNSLTGRVYSSDPRANLFEWGGKTAPHEILPDKADALLIALGGAKIFAARVEHPGGKYAPRNIIHGAFDQMKPEIQSGLERDVDEIAARVAL